MPFVFSVDLSDRAVDQPNLFVSPGERMAAQFPAKYVADLGDDFDFGRMVKLRIFELVESRDSATNAQIELCVRFRKAKEALDSLAVASARYEFKAILQEFPQDGPSKHFLRMIERRS